MSIGIISAVEAVVAQPSGVNANGPVMFSLFDQNPNGIKGEIALRRSCNRSVR
jgi:hypothetical protein